MKHSIRFYIFLFVGLTSCSNNLDLIDPTDPVPVVYFQLNPDDSVFYLTLTRTISGYQSAYELARNADQLFYDSVDICLEGWSDSFKIMETKFKHVDRIKVPGTFAEGPGHCYQALNESFQFANSTITSFRLVINAPGMAEPVTARISTFTISSTPSRYDHEINFYPSGYKYPPERNSSSILKYDQLEETANKVQYQQLVCEFHYQEYEGSWIDHSVTFSIRKNTLIVEPILYADFFFAKVAASIKPISDTITRKFVSLDLIFLSSDQYYKDYVETIEHDGNLDLLPKGNIVNGYGLFTLIRIARYNDMTLSQVSLDSLSMGHLTKQLRFVKW